MWQNKCSPCLLIFLNSCTACIFFLRFIYLFERQSHREADAVRERGVFHLLVHSPDGCNGRICTDPKPEARSFFWVFQTGAGAQRLGPFSSAFPGHSRELDRKWSSWDLNQHPYGMPAQQVEALPAMLQHRPLDLLLYSKSDDSDVCLTRTVRLRREYDSDCLLQ